ncbi:hypothetical protein UFOVP1625_17 [uncultured Caudovirales phage]|uniref:Uncharacterized protein n=1 Tax=uncultured Caudovirales phage TaxID=2100421 RepID=A0A6J5SY35_9CAUD|nr:hypothetical protein UFOVP1625_17 [uncultured Caudovirales phage]
MAWLWVECGIAESVFWKMTPAKVSAVVTARKERIKREDYRAGIITATIRSALGAKNVDVFDDFPEYKTKKVPAKGTNLSGYFKTLIAHQNSAGTKS